MEYSHKPLVQLFYCGLARYQFWLQTTPIILYHPLSLNVQTTQDNFIMVKSQPTNVLCQGKCMCKSEMICTLQVSRPFWIFATKVWGRIRISFLRKSLLNSINSSIKSIGNFDQGLLASAFFFFPCVFNNWKSFQVIRYNC